MSMFPSLLHSASQLLNLVLWILHKVLQLEKRVRFLSLSWILTLGEGFSYYNMVKTQEKLHHHFLLDLLHKSQYRQCNLMEIGFP
jgi:hypothetical protein